MWRCVEIGRDTEISVSCCDTLIEYNNRNMNVVVLDLHSGIAKKIDPIFSDGAREKIEWLYGHCVDGIIYMHLMVDGVLYRGSLLSSKISFDPWNDGRSHSVKLRLRSSERRWEKRNGREEKWERSWSEFVRRLRSIREIWRRWRRRIRGGQTRSVGFVLLWQRYKERRLVYYCRACLALCSEVFLP